MVGLRVHYLENETMNNQIILRPDQWNLKLGAYGGWQAGKRNMLLVLPTGGGKSVIVSDIVKDYAQQNTPQIVIAHRQELVGQMSLHVARRGISHQVIGPKGIVAECAAAHREEFGRSFVNPDAVCSVGGVDTLVSRWDELQPWAQQIRLWTIDEAHHVLRNNKWGKAVAMFPNANGLGVTATPRRADGYGLGIHADGVFYDMVIGPTMRQLIDAGALSEFEFVVPESDFVIDDDDVTPSGDFSPVKMREASKKSHIVGDVVANYLKYAPGKRGITFATDVETANEIAQRFNDAGVPAASISAKTPSATRREYIRWFRSGKLLQLVNVDLIGEGFDLPAVEVVSLARPTASLAVYLQQVGRCLRTMAGKIAGLIIDHVSNYKRHRFPDHLHAWTLDRREKRGKKKEPDPELIDLKVCKNCSKPYEMFHACCPYCGHVPPLPEGRRTIEQVDGDLRLLDRETLAAMRAQATLETPAGVAGRAEMAAGALAGAGAAARQRERIETQQRLSLAIANWAARERHRGRPDDQSYRRFYHALGVDVLTALGLPRVDMERLSATIEGWIQ